MTYSAQELERFQKREDLIASGVNPYPIGKGLDVSGVARRSSLAYVLGLASTLQAKEHSGRNAIVLGRVLTVRNSGKLCFAVIQHDGERLQLQLSRDVVGVDSLASWKKMVDRGDVVEAAGEVISSFTGEPTVLVDEWQIVSKAVRALPNLHDDLSDEVRVRHPHLGYITDVERFRLAKARSAAVRAVRNTLDRQHKYHELETPILQPVHGGASARPFTTEAHAYSGNDLYLRIAVELYLKRAVIAGFDRVYELGRNFRNEGADRTHSPEFTMLEAYEVSSDYEDMAERAQELIYRMAGELQAFVRPELAESVVRWENTLVTPGPRPVWKRVDFYGSLSDALGEQVDAETTKEVLLGFATQHGVEIPHVGSAVPGKVAEELWEALVKPNLGVEPVFVFDFPADTSPLAARHRTRPGVAEKWDLYVAGVEVGTGYSELTDPVQQRKAFEEQALQAAGGDPEAMRLDEDFLTAIEYGMPPTGGLGLGIDRVVMTLTDRSIRDIQAFPFVAPIKKD